jgi:hypothetical protein
MISPSALAISSNLKALMTEESELATLLGIVVSMRIDTQMSRALSK